MTTTLGLYLQLANWHRARREGTIDSQQLEIRRVLNSGPESENSLSPSSLFRREAGPFAGLCQSPVEGPAIRAGHHPAMAPRPAEAASASKPAGPTRI